MVFQENPFDFWRFCPISLLEMFAKLRFLLDTNIQNDEKSRVWCPNFPSNWILMEDEFWKVFIHELLCAAEAVITD